MNTDRRGPISRILQRAFEYRDTAPSEQEVDAIISRYREQTSVLPPVQPITYPIRVAQPQPRVFGKRVH